MLARDLEVAARFSKECDLDAITKEGDLVNRKGGFEGGFHDERASRIGAVFKIRESRAALDALLQKERELKEASEQAEAKVSEVVRELQQLETEKSHLRQNGDQLTREIKTRTKQLEAAMAGLEAQKKGISAQQSQIQVATAQQEAYRKEQASALVEKLSTKERAELSRLEERQRALQSDIETLEKDVMRVTAAKDKITADLNGNLLKSKEELERTLAEVSEDASGGNDFETALANLQVEKDHCKAQFASLQKEVAEMDAIIAQKRSEGAADEKALDEQRSAEQQLQEKIAEATKMLDKLLNKRSMLLETVQSRQRMIRDLGTLPRKEMEDVRNLSEKQLMSTLKEVNERLKKYSSVNRKALDQFVSFNEQRETLMQRKDEMDRDSVAIQQMIESLDAQKDEAILRTFRGVSHHFAEVFSELVPGGAGQLIMRTSMDTAQSKNQAAAASSSSAAAGKNAEGEDESTENLQDRILDDEDEENPTTGPGALAISTFQGVQVRVSFSGAGQQYQMNQLSGGQKALVALALIFAIQRCDPAPFYLFDEIDQALDANYRAGVARLIHKQVNSETAPAQFITTTFRPELVAAADRCYGIGLLNKVSNIYSLEKVINFVAR